jgi:poly-gamma-glutamate capsule biosynthesis protein CapA/YwtB (metallophosphatase superfamily)
MALIRPRDGGTCAGEDVCAGLGSSSGIAANAQWGDMAGKLILTGDVNLMKVADPTIPFRQVAAALHTADVVFGNLECCLHLPARRSHDTEGFFADPQIGGEALRLGGFHAVGVANNVNYGADNIGASLAVLDRLGVSHTGAGANLAAARAPAIVARNGLRVGVVQRSSVYWPTDHEAAADSPGIAVIRGHTAYQVPTGRLVPGMPPPNRPGVPPLVVTWADAAYLAEFQKDIAALRPQADIVVASCHWGLGREPLQYMMDIAHAAIDTGADIVMGHGPHYLLPIEIYKGRPIFYGLCNFTFATGHLGRKHSGWVGILIDVTFERGVVAGCEFRFVRSNDNNETYLCLLADEAETLADLTRRSEKNGVKLVPVGDRVRVTAT